MTTTTRRAAHRRTRAIVASVGLLVALVLVAVLVQQRSSDEPTGDGTSAPDAGSQTTDGPPPSADPEPTESVAPLDVATPDAGPIGAQDEEVQRVEQSVALVIEATNEIGSRGDGAIDGLDGIASDFVLGELENLSREFHDQGLTQTGEAHVVSTELIDADLDADPATMTLAVCVDVSDIRITDAAGVDQSDRLYNPGQPVRHIYGAVHVGGVWKLSSHEIPDEQSCQPVEESA